MAKLTIAPLTRLEGHGEVELILQQGRLAEVRVCLTESPRLFESIVSGHRFDEVPDLVCRICAICSAVHKLTAISALEQAMNVRVPHAAEVVRELLLLGGHLQSHALHLFLLVLPDFYGEESIVPLLKKKHPLAIAGLSLKAFGNLLQETMGGRVIHPVNPVFGGVKHRPRSKQLAELIDQAEQWRQRWPALSSEFIAKASYPKASKICGTPLTVSQQNGVSLSGAYLQSGTDSFIPVEGYSSLLNEHKLSYSHAKVSGDSDRSFLTGALSRQLLLQDEHQPANDLRQEQGIHANNTAQVYEISWILDRVILLLEELKNCLPSEPLVADFTFPRAGTGTSAMEAPRGLLIHHYVVDEWGLVVSADIVTPTAINQKAMAEQIMVDLGDERNHQKLRTASERIIRSYDPCISCAVHILEETL